MNNRKIYLALASLALTIGIVTLAMGEGASTTQGSVTVIQLETTQKVSRLTTTSAQVTEEGRARVGLTCECASGKCLTQSGQKLTCNGKLNIQAESKPRQSSAPRVIDKRK